MASPWHSAVASPWHSAVASPWYSAVASLSTWRSAAEIAQGIVVGTGLAHLTALRSAVEMVQAVAVTPSHPQGTQSDGLDAREVGNLAALRDRHEVVVVVLRPSYHLGRRKIRCLSPAVLALRSVQKVRWDGWSLLGVGLPKKFRARSSTHFV